jgi:hypothetical protein
VTFKGSIAPGDINAVSVACPPGQTSVSGGAITAGAGYVFSDDSFGGSGWSVGYDNYGGSVSADVTAVAYCAPSGQATAPPGRRRPARQGHRTSALDPQVARLPLR